MIREFLKRIFSLNKDEKEQEYFQQRVNTELDQIKRMADTDNIIFGITYDINDYVVYYDMHLSIDKEMFNTDQRICEKDIINVVVYGGAFGCKFISHSTVMEAIPASINDIEDSEVILIENDGLYYMRETGMIIDKDWTVNEALKYMKGYEHNDDLSALICLKEPQKLFKNEFKRAKQKYPDTNLYVSLCYPRGKINYTICPIDRIKYKIKDKKITD